MHARYGNTAQMMASVPSAADGRRGQRIWRGWQATITREHPNACVSVGRPRPGSSTSWYVSYDTAKNNMAAEESERRYEGRGGRRFFGAFSC